MQVEFLGSFPGLHGRPEPVRPEFALLGRSNCGKSSLINYLLGRKELARTSRQPGKTQLLNYFRVDARFDLVDLPGYGYAKVSKAQRESWWSLFRRYLTTDQRLAGTLHLLDARHEPGDHDQEISALLRDQGLPFAVVLTKMDKLTQRDRLPAFRRIIDGLALPAETPFLLTSSRRGRGRDEVLAWIDEVLTGDDHGV
ncbi:MAG: ribosome biogenesis GTP-binding protein YihA/YsxC [Candidatus Krumholzibacteriia bacterium]